MYRAARRTGVVESRPPRTAAGRHAAATSPLNDRPEPSDAQKEAGNYAKGHVRISGMDVSIENPKGSMRRSKADATEPWEVEMPAHYGYIRGTKGADGDHVDLFIGPKGDNGRFWVINQNVPDGKRFDEHKVLTGVESAEEAKALYLASFANGFGDRVFGSIGAEIGAPRLRELLPSLERPKPLLVKSVSAAQAATVPMTAPAAEIQAQAETAPAAPAPVAKAERPRELIELRKRASVLASLRACLSS